MHDAKYVIFLTHTLLLPFTPPTAIASTSPCQGRCFLRCLDYCSGQSSVRKEDAGRPALLNREPLTQLLQP